MWVSNVQKQICGNTWVSNVQTHASNTKSVSNKTQNPWSENHRRHSFNIETLIDITHFIQELVR